MAGVPTRRDTGLGAVRMVATERKRVFVNETAAEGEFAALWRAALQ
jgi:hypothetical protein